MSDGAIRHASPHPPNPEDKHKCGGCRLQAEIDRFRGIERVIREEHARVCLCPFDGTDDGCNLIGGVWLAAALRTEPERSRE